MKLLCNKPFLINCLLVLLTLGARAQYTETFESQAPYQSTFNSDGQAFKMTLPFSIYSSRNGIGYGGSNRFVDNINSTVKNQLNTISTTDAKLISVQNFWIFTSVDGGNNPSTNGSLIITGKINGATVFSITKSVGFISSFGTSNGFTYVNLSSEGGTDFSKVAINEISFQLQGEFNYLAIDNFTWTKAGILPVNVIQFSGNNQSGKVSLNWSTSCESNSSHFLVERSTNGTNYTAIARIKGGGNSSILTNYQTFDENPASGNNYYRLVAVDFDGKRKNHGVVLIKNQGGYFSTGVYPNPSSGNSITLKGGNNLMGQLYTIIDISGKVLQNGIISGSSQSINISSIAKGNYFLKLSDGQAIQWIKN